MKRATRLVPVALALVAAGGCSSGSSPKAQPSADGGDAGASLLPGEVCDPSTAPTVVVHFDPPSIVMAPGQSRPVRLIVDPDLCAAVTASFAVKDGSIAKTVDSAPLDLRHPSFDFSVSALAAGSTSLSVTVQRPTDAAPTSGTLAIEVRPDAKPPACTPGNDDAAPATLSASSATISGKGALAGASLGVPPGAFGRTDEWALPTFDGRIACAPGAGGGAADLTAGVAGSPTALGPAVTFDVPANAAWSTKSLRRELDFAVPVNPAAMPQAARMRHLLVLYQGPRAKTPRPITIANPRFDRLASGDWVLRFESPWFGTYQAAVLPNAGTVSHKRHLTHRAVLGISMGGGGAALFGFHHHDEFDAIAPLGGNSDLTWLTWYFEQYKFGGFCPVSNPGCQTYAPNMYPLDEVLAHTEDFDHWFFQPGAGTGGSFSRSGWTQILEDFLIMGGNPNGQNGDPAIPFMVVGPKSTDPFVHGVGVTDPVTGQPVDCSVTIDPIGPNSHDSAAMQAQEQVDEQHQQAIQAACLSSRCDPKNAWVAKTGFYDAAYNPDGSRPVITFCDGGQNGQSPYVDTWTNPDPSNQTPSNIALAVDLNGNGVRDLGEPVIRQGQEPFDDDGTDGLADKDEPGFDPMNNPDPNGDDYDFQLNPNGTENDHVWEQGEPYQDVGLDGVKGTPQQSAGGYDVGEGDGQFTMSAGAQHLFQLDPHSMLHGRTAPAAGPLDATAMSRLAVWADGGVRDMANFGAVANHLVGAVASVKKGDGTQAMATAFYNNFENLPGSDPTQPDQYLASNVLWADVPWAAHLRYGYVDATSQMIANGDGQHVGTGSQILYRLVTGFYFANRSWPDADRTLSDSLDVSDAPDAGGNAAPTSINELCAGKDPSSCCETQGHCETYFTGPTTGRTGPLAVTLPPGYSLAGSQQRNLRYPVLYVLHGYGQDPRDLEATAAITQNYMSDSQRSAATRLAKMIVVYVDGRCRIDPTTKAPECIRGTFYVDSNRSVNGHKMAQLDDWFDEVIQYVDKNYRTLPASDVDVVE